ncbi:molecular chaperone [Pseudomonas sp. 7P_10.2_Bac1]|uniref:fimbrial biogenesis chaperone n=1 Tax=Pseudomonas sp. 7P_10.2_Bac1 TaxID=2971614 RepID=UPI0021C85656|nr:molecular chaperone [Pseudomonas sp. 7P_10.2_Bac1]MCU1727482.1 molecular chaperone [Pseudomonas sp. 7P_10.2_Bac1]
MFRLKKASAALAVFLCSLSIHTANASVVMTGTRVIYPAQAQEKTVQLSNKNALPYMIQMWVDNKPDNNEPQKASAPFIANPQIFRINPNDGQMVRLIFTGNNLAKDRETLFYLSFLQIPAIKASEMQANKLLLSINSRMKLFYRPQQLAGNPDELSQSLSFKVKGNSIIASNNSGYFATVRDAKILHAGKPLPLKQGVMIPPLSEVDWTLPSSTLASKGDTLRLTLVNDYGADVTSDLLLN